MSGLLIDGSLVPVSGLSVIPPASHGGPTWAALGAGDYGARPTRWVRQVIVHTTKGLWPQPVSPGAGNRQHAAQVANMWREDPVHSAAQIIVDSDGSVACLCDLARIASYHAEGSNPWSIGIEMYQEVDGSVYEATLSATAILVKALCESFGIPEQFPCGPYRSVPLARMEVQRDGRRHQLGGPDVVGVLGHRNNTSARGRGDPGDEIWLRLAALGFEALDYDAGEDLAVGKQRQAVLNAHGERLVVDGLVGPASMAAARRQGFVRWRDVHG
jgi:hypothetical protein